MLDRKPLLTRAGIVAVVVLVATLVLSGGVSGATVSSCQVINSSGTYVLNASITNSSATKCIEITSSDVTFDGAGYTIEGQDTVSTYGVYVYNSSTALTNVTVKNLNATDWYYGIYYRSTENGSMTNNTANSNSQYGIYIESSSNNTLTNNTANSNSLSGIYVDAANNTLINNNANYNNEYGFFLECCSADYNTLINNTAYNNSYSGFYQYYSPNTNFINNTAYNNSQHGFHSYGDPQTFTGNAAYNNSGHGFYLDDSSYSTLTNNTANSNNQSGIYIYLSSNNTLINNTANSNNNSGIYLDSSDYNTISDGTVNNNEDKGVYVDSSNGVTIAGVGIHNNPNGGIYDAAACICSNQTFSYNNISGSTYGIYLSWEDNSTIHGNKIWNNTYGIYSSLSSSNTIYNNFLNNTNNFNLSSSNNDWNTTLTTGTNIIGGPYLGGNFWAYPNGTGFSETCTDGDSDGICDLSYTLNSSNIDYLPLAAYTEPPPTINLILPDENQTILSSTVTFVFFSVDNSSTALYYNLTIDGAVNMTNQSAVSGENESINVSGLPDGGHNWSITIWDGDDSANTSETRNFTVLTQVTIPDVIVPPIVNTTNGSGIVDLADQGVPEEVINQTGVTGYEYIITTNGTTPVINLSVNIFIEPPAEVSDIVNESGAVPGFYYKIEVNDSSWYDNVTEIQLRIYYNISTINLPSGVSESSLRPVRYTNGSWLRLECTDLGGCTATLADETELYAAGAVISSQNDTHPYVWANLSNFSVYGIAGAVYGVSGSVYGVSGGIYVPTVIQPTGITVIKITSNTIGNLIRQLGFMTRQFYITTSELAGVLGALDLTSTTLNLAEAANRETWKPVQTLKGDSYAITSEHVLAKYPESAEVIISRGDLGVDSMASVAYARALGIPILLVKPGEIPEVTQTALKELGTNSVIVVGGPAAVSEEVAGRLPNVTRIWGQDRHETAVKIAEELMAREGVDTLVITDGLNPDMMAVAIAAKYNAPIIYVAGNEITPDTGAFLEKHAFKRIVVIGVTETAENEIRTRTS